MDEFGKIEEKLVFTIKELCRVCYTCVRECPAKAIKIANGQAEVIEDRCIACGNCVKVCSQNAKQFRDERADVKEILKREKKVVAIVAPSFPAEFMELEDHRVLVGMVRAFGFYRVCEVGFGADLVAAKYKELYSSDLPMKYISSDCPAIVKYVEMYHPELTDNLAPYVSPIVAMARVVRKHHGDDTKIIFIGPCVAKKNESDEIDAVITFKELRAMLNMQNINPDKVSPSEFDLPRAGRGAIFPITRGLMQTVQIQDDFSDGNLIVAEGRLNFQEALNEFENGLLNDQHLELLCCEGCIMGPGISSGGKRFARRAYVSNYVKKKLSEEEVEIWKQQFEIYSSIDLSRSFKSNDMRSPIPKRDRIDETLKEMGKVEPKDHLNCGACGYYTCEKHAIAIVEGLAEVEMCLPYALEQLHTMVEDLAETNTKLASMKQALKQSEKLAHMGQLSAGIAHELNNPLGVVTMYASILLDETGEDNPVYGDLKLIVEQVDRCRNIVGGLLNFARKNQVQLADCSAVDLVNKSVKSTILPEGIECSIKNDLRDASIRIDEEQMIQALSNILKNGVEAMPDGGKLSVELVEDNEYIIFEISDTGMGIPEDMQSKIFEPFFTTKGIGKGTGLGLATTYGIIKMHKGKIEVYSNTNAEKGSTGTTFTVFLPKTLTS